MIGSDFERFGGLFLDDLLLTPHTGLNSLGFPVSRMIDSSSADGAIVVEYSAQYDYFGRGMSKAENDLAHALSRQPDAKLILLLAAQLNAPKDH
ncbi:hypothetical protein [Bradyrhizobium sp. USDA 3315]